MRILLIDDHTLFRRGLETLLEHHGIKVVAAVGSGRDGLVFARKLKPEVILLDLRMPEMDGLDILSELRSEGLDMPVVMLTTSNEERDLVESLRNGANGYLLKDMEPQELVAALHEIVGGKTVVAPEMTAVMAQVIQGGPTRPVSTEVEVEGPSPFSELTPREMEILELLAEGQSNKVIARNLGISDGTVKLHVKAILRKLQVHSRVEAAVMAVERNLFPKDGSSPRESAGG